MTQNRWIVIYDGADPAWTRAYFAAPPKEGQPPPMAKKTKKKKRIKKTRTSPLFSTSDSYRASVINKRNRLPVIVTGVSPGKEMTIAGNKLGTLGIDERYQRLRIGTQVNNLIIVIKAGGLIPDPITVVRRDDGSLWIVDGQQRFWAHFDTDTALRAKVFTIDDDVKDKLAAERQLYAALNNSVRQSPANMLKAHPGPMAEMLRARHETETDPLYRRIQLETSNKSGTISASAMCVGALRACGMRHGGNLNEQVLPRLDTLLANSTQRRRIERYLDLMAMVFPTSIFPKMPPSMPVRALGSYSFTQWAKRPPKLPSVASINRMRLIKWASVCQSSADRFIPVAEHEFATRWKEAR